MPEKGFFSPLLLSLLLTCCRTLDSSLLLRRGLSLSISKTNWFSLFTNQSPNRRKVFDRSELRAMDSKLLNAARRNDENHIRELFKRDPNILLGQTPEGNTALHLSARFGWVSSLETICQLCPPSLLTRCNNKGQTALHSAALGSNLRAVIMITSKVMPADVEHGGQESLKEMMRMTDSNRDTALHLAIIKGYDEDVASKLIDLGAGEGLAEMVNNRGESPLYLAALSGMSRIVRRLLELGPSNNRSEPPPPPPPYNQTDTAIAGDNTGTSCHHSNSRRAPVMDRTALHAAVIARNIDTAKELLQKWPRMDKVADGSGWIPLHYAAKLGDVEMVDLLLKHDFSTGYRKDKNGNMAIHIAAQESWGNTFSRIQVWCPDSVDAINKNGENVLHCTVQNLYDNVAHKISKVAELRQLINHQDNNGNTPLHLAVLQDKYHLSFDFFAKSKALNPMILNNDGYTAYDLFCLRETQLNDQAFFRYYFEHLLSKKYNLSLVNSGGDPPWGKMERLQKYANNSSLVATLMATITFAAAFTMPGGYSSGDGKAVLFKNAALKVFIVSDTISMCCSLLAAYLFSSWNSCKRPKIFYKTYAFFSPRLMKVAFWGMLVAFSAGMYAVLAPNCMWLAILVCLLCSLIPFIFRLVDNYWKLEH